MKKIVIIGGGVAGLTAGIFAQKAGYNTVIVENHKITGGQLTGWSRQGHHIDNCIHWLTGTNKNDELYKLWADIGMIEEGKLYQSEALYTYEKDGVTLSLYNDIDRLEKEMLEISPADEKRIKELVIAVKTVQGLMGIGGDNHNEKISIADKITNVPRLLKYVRSNVGDIAKTFDNEVIDGFLNSLLTDRFSSLALIGIFAVYTGANGALPQGGSLAAARRITERYLSLGGRVLTNTSVTKINVENGEAYSLMTKGGEEIFADAFIVTADPKSVFGHVLDAEMPDALKRCYENKNNHRFSAIQCAFSCDIKDIPFKGDYIYDLNYAEKKILKSDFLIVREFSHEPSFAPVGKTVLQTMCFIDECECRKYLDLKCEGVAYAKKKKELENAVIGALLRKFPQMKSSIITLDVWTPATYKEYTASDVGSFMSFAFGAGSLPKMVSGRTEVKNVFLATQWQRAPGGLPIAAEAGRSSIKYIDKYFAKQARTEQVMRLLRLPFMKKTAKQP